MDHSSIPSTSPAHSFAASSVSPVLELRQAPAPYPPAAVPPQTDVWNGRPFRSRKSRPCDACRKSKTRCALPVTGPPCLECSQTKKDCTFQQEAPKRKKKAPEDAQPAASTSGPQPAFPSASLAPSRTSPLSQQDFPSMSAVSLGKRPATDSDHVEQRPTQVRVVSTSPHSQPAQSQHGLDILSQMVTSLDLSQSDYFEPHVLTAPVTDDLLPILGTDGERVPDRPHVRQISTDSKNPIYVVFSPKSHGRNSAPDPASALLFRFRNLISSLSPQTETSLLQSFIDKVHPALPVLPSSSVESSPPYLLAAVFSTALCLSKQTREISHVLKLLTLRPNGEEHSSESSRLSTIAAECLNLDSRFLPDARGTYLRLARTIALAQLLGLHLSPLSWAISQGEQFLRIHLWWILFNHDAWTSFLNSRPSHIQSSNFEVPFPSLDTLHVARSLSPSSTLSLDPSTHDSSLSFVDSCHLAHLVGRLQSDICTLAAKHAPATDKLDILDGLEEDAEAIAARWERARSLTVERAPGVNSFLLLLLSFQAMLRRISIEMESSLGGPFVPDEETLKIFGRVVEFLVGLSSVALDGYWSCYAPHVISSLTSSLIRICLASASAPSSPPSPNSQNEPQGAPAQSVSVRSLTLLSSLIVFLLSAKHEHSWDIADPALVRASMVATRLKSLDEHMPIIQALEGTYVSPSAAVDVELPFDLDEATAAAAMTNWDLEGLDMGWLPWTGPELNTDDLMTGGIW